MALFSIVLLLLKHSVVRFALGMYSVCKVENSKFYHSDSSHNQCPSQALSDTKYQPYMTKVFLENKWRFVTQEARQTGLGLCIAQSSCRLWKNDWKIIVNMFWAFFHRSVYLGTNFNGTQSSLTRWSFLYWGTMVPHHVRAPDTFLYRYQKCHHSCTQSINTGSYNYKLQFLLDLCPS